MSQVERTFSIIKPDAVAAGQAGEILAMLEKAGFRILGMRMLKLSREQAEGFYAVHRERPFFPSLVKFIVQGEEFDDATYQETGHVEIDFGLDSLFVQENVELTEETQAKIRDNVAKLVEFTKKAEMNTRATSRRLWSESEESLAQKLIARLQKVQ